MLLEGLAHIARAGADEQRAVVQASPSDEGAIRPNALRCPPIGGADADVADGHPPTQRSVTKVDELTVLTAPTVVPLHHA